MTSPAKWKPQPDEPVATTVKPDRSELVEAQRREYGDAWDEFVPGVSITVGEIAANAIDDALAEWPGKTEQDVRADERERIAQEIALLDDGGWSDNVTRLIAQASRIAREGGRTDG